MIRAKSEGLAGERMMVLSSLLVALIALGLMLTARPAHAASTTFTVTNTFDPGDGICNSSCTLRDAIIAANANNNTSEQDQIDFSIPGEGVRTIRPSSELPPIEEPVIIDGYTQPGASANELARGTNANLLVELDGSNTGSSADGLEIEASNVVIRGLVINRFFTGIQIFSSDVPTDNNRIEGNFIGTDASGIQALGNGFGVDVAEGENSENNVVGGTSPASRNLISGNTADGVFINAPRTRVLGNLIGTRKDGIRRLGNADQGLHIEDGEGTIVGGTTPGAANTIAFNGEEGVFVLLNSASGNRILGNSIFGNGLLGIDLGDDIFSTAEGDGPTPNDPGDVDTGPNGLQNKPVISSATTTGTKITIKGKLNSTPNSTFAVRFFSNVASEPAGNEGRRFLGQKSVTTNADGNTGTFTRVLAVRVPAGQKVTATATGSEGTSEFSAARVVE